MVSTFLQISGIPGFYGQYKSGSGELLPPEGISIPPKLPLLLTVLSPPLHNSFQEQIVCGRKRQRETEEPLDPFAVRALPRQRFRMHQLPEQTEKQDQDVSAQKQK